MGQRRAQAPKNVVIRWENNLPFWSTSMSICEGSYKTSTGSIDVNWDIVPGLFLVLIQDLRDLFDRLIMAGIRATHWVTSSDLVLPIRKGV